MRTHVDLFSGIGGFALAVRWAGVETIAFAEIDPYASRVLKRHWPNVRNYGRVQDVPAINAWLLTGGVPCQPASVAGKRLGAADDRWLWPEALAAVERGNYEWVLFENPTGILSLNDGLEFERICAALEGQGYEVQPLVIPACGVGALHRRNRIWIMAHRPSDRCGQGRSGRFDSGRAREREPERSFQDVVHTNGRRLERHECGILANQGEGRSNPDITGSTWWSVEPNVGRLANGVSDRVGKLRCLGNSIVTQVAYQLIKRMTEAETHNEMSLETQNEESHGVVSALP